MGISLQTNIASLVAQNNLSMNSAFQLSTITALTSGYRINSSADDAAGLAVANQYRSNVAQLTQGVQNANDGISALQIVDGGLNNISLMLDRLQTLATQSASATFQGNRATLNTEYQALLGEITQQANNIGLASGGQYNVVNTVFIGGGNNLANSQISINLSGTSNQVDSNGLGIGLTSVGAGGTTLAGNAVRIDAPGATFLAAAAQTFTFNLYSTNGGAQTQTITVGGAGALTEDQVLSSLNSSLTQYGIQATVGSNGQLQFGGATPFTVKTTTAAADLIATTNSTATNSGVYSTLGQTPYAPAIETDTFQNGQGTATVSLTAGDTLASALSKINAQTAAIGIYAVANSAGTGITIESASNFTASSTAAGVFAALGPQAITAPSTAGSLTGNAQAAITAISSAIQNLGLVQGRVGAGENMLNYGVSLANSQITNFSAAESRIRDADMAKEAANLTKGQVLEQASIAALAQANAAPQAVLALLK
ncbi:MAG TPA: flagellin [Bryobacteraceae bacterium]|jgi:flagellin|nr:flagellin [Bryobacteraceae bacterium]